MNRICEKIEMVRLKRDITQAELESLAGLPPNRVSKWVCGSGEPTLRQGRRIAAALGVDLGWLSDDRAPDEDWAVIRGLTPIQSHILYLCGQVGEEAAARMLTRAMMEGLAASSGAGEAGEAGPAQAPVLRDLTAERERDARKGARRRRPKGDDGGEGSGAGGAPGRVVLRATTDN